MKIDKEDIISYYNKLDRSLFMEENKMYAHVDSPFPIGYGQTISQSSLVLYMTINLDIDSEHKVLEIGTGSGYQSAFLAKFSKELYTVEIIEPLYLKAKKRLSAMGFDNIEYKLGNGSFGWIEKSPFDRIIVTAAAGNIPEMLIEQLAPLGKMIIPVGEIWQRLVFVTKDIDGRISYQNDISVRFVKLV
ncbi:MAG: protein-L-isoaspartate O-methyltransferase [Clostridiales bacterium]|nr:protein-L-isoaspartate O-methyltransferase [Clostridiales bacterium]